MYLQLALAILYAAEKRAKRENRDANEQYAWALECGTPYAEDMAFDACRRTGRLVDEIEDVILDLEDMAEIGVLQLEVAA